MAELSAATKANIRKARTVGNISPDHYQTPYKNIAELLIQRASSSGDKTWLIFYSDESGRYEYSYKLFFDSVLKTANVLVSREIGRGDRIATVAYNHADTVIQYFAAWIIGAVVVPINVGEDDKRIGYILQNSNVKLAFVRSEFIGRMKKILQNMPTVKTIVEAGMKSSSTSYDNRHEILQGTTKIPEPEYIDFDSAVEALRTDLNRLPDVSLEDEALIVYTSGTTGLPKGVVLTQYNLLVDAKAISEWHRMTPDQRMMCVLPIHHVNGTIVTLMTPLYYGGSVVLNQKFHSDKFFERIAAEKVHVVSVVPTLLQFLLHEKKGKPEGGISQLRHIICGAGPLTVELALQFEDRFAIPIIHGYGLSETTCYSCFLPVDLSLKEHREWLSNYGFPSIGMPLPTNEMTIHDEHGNEVAQNTKGEIVIRGHNVMKCYYAQPEANEKTFEFGWFRSGDEGFYTSHPGGGKIFFITGRIKELIIRGGVNISPFEIDEVLMNMPGIKAGLSVGFENDWYGEEVGAYVQLNNGVTMKQEEVIGYCRKFFPYQKCPKAVIFGNEIPVTSTGKYQRNRLKPLFKEWKSVQFTESRRS